MDAREIELIEKYTPQDPLLQDLYQKHKELDRRLQKFGKKPFLTAAEERKEQELKKLKLAQKDRMMKILKKYRS
jgi:uncharacterized protein YdcH (DUF465 family)